MGTGGKGNKDIYSFLCLCWARHSSGCIHLLLVKVSIGPFPMAAVVTKFWWYHSLSLFLPARWLMASHCYYSLDVSLSFVTAPDSDMSGNSHFIQLFSVNLLLCHLFPGWIMRWHGKAALSFCFLPLPMLFSLPIMPSSPFLSSKLLFLLQ